MSASDARGAENGGASIRYSACRFPAAEARVAQDLSRLATGIDSEMGDALRALVLVGPFARGEGGMLGLGAEPRPAAPGYELLALVRRTARRHSAALNAMGASWSRLLRAEVRIHAFSPRALPHVPASRFWFHVGCGQRLTLAGDPTLIAAVPAWSARELRWQEADFALCEALSALAVVALEAPTDAARELSAMQRAVLAVGDALLLWRDEYAETLAARSEALTRAQAAAGLRAAYREAIAWNAEPDAWRPVTGSLESWLEATRRTLQETFLHAEAERLHTARDLVGYASDPRPLHRDTRARPGGRLARAAADLSLASTEIAGWLARPEERLLRCCAALGFGPHAKSCRAVAANLLRVKPEAAALAKALRELAASALPDALQ